MGAVNGSNGNDLVLRVAKATPVADLAGAISNAVYDGRHVSLRFVGAAAGMQALKAVAVARGFVAPRAIDLSVKPGFVDIEMPDKMVTGMTMIIVTD
jgi:stage V sporulation protein S